MNQNTFAVNANLLKRTGAAILDFLFFISSTLLLISYVFGPIYEQQYGTAQLATELSTYQLASYLYTEDSETEILRNLSLEEAPTGIYRYYAEFKNTKVYDEEEGPFVFSMTWYNETILKINETDSLFALDPNDLSGIAVLNQGVTTEARDAFYTTTYRETLLDFNQYPPFADLVMTINRYFLEVVSLSAVIAVVIYYLLFPLIFKNGQTLGKKTLGLALVNTQGYRIQWWQTVVRFLVIVLTFYTAPISVFGSVLISYTLMVFSKRNRSGNDFLALTRVIQTKESLIFDNEDAFLNYQKELGQSPILNDEKISD
jgi:uncharacterized RDD family membrane protein YckC